MLSLLLLLLLAVAFRFFGLRDFDVPEAESTAETAVVFVIESRLDVVDVVVALEGDALFNELVVVLAVDELVL